MAWSTSNLSGAGVSALIGGSFYGTSQTFASDTINAALYGNTGTPNKDDTLAHNAYNGTGGQWVTANEVTGTNYTAGGTALTSKSNTEATGTVTVTAANPSWASATISNVYGTLVYDNTVTNKYAYCWNYFGGSQSVTSGTFTVQWNASGIFTVTIS
ncbi:MAG TPA: hypothetical protein VHE33_15385 [Acidobacteriaceae bacterium]|nr:hypothetical protein [Acidobacteriaceae bacterium]